MTGSINPDQINKDNDQKYQTKTQYKWFGSRGSNQMKQD